jgi:hypothetical protein
LTSFSALKTPGWISASASGGQQVYAVEIAKARP